MSDVDTMADICKVIDNGPGGQDGLASALDPVAAAQVLHLFTGEGYEPGQFRAYLYAAMSVADPENLARLLTGFPNEGLAFVVGKYVPGGLTMLRAVVDGGVVDRG